MRILALLLTFFTGCSGCVSVPDLASAKATAVRLEWRSELSSRVCSGTAVGRHTLLSAAHCFGDKAGEMLVNDVRVDYLVVANDQNDHVFVRVSIRFPRVAMRGPNPMQGDAVFTHGNPDGYKDLMIRGYVSGWVDGKMELDSNNWHGDSGAAVFNQYGQIVGVVSEEFPWPNEGWRLTEITAFKFSPADWEAAKA